MRPCFKRAPALSLAAFAAWITFDRPASACTGGIFRFEDIFESADVVLRATVTKIEDATETSLGAQNFVTGDKIAALQVSEVWKGISASTAHLNYTEQSSACGVELEEGEMITLFAGQDRNGQLYARWPQIAEHSTFILDLPFLVAYRQQTDALIAAAKAGGEAEGFALARHLTRWNDSFRAKLVYQELIDKYANDAEGHLGLAIAQHASGEQDQATRSLQSAIAADASLRQIEPAAEAAYWGSPKDIRIARAKFLLTGLLDEYSRDWSNLVANERCDGEGASLGDAIFDDSNLTRCSFERARVANTSFASADLTNVSFEYADLQETDFSSASLTGAKFELSRMRSITWAGANLRNADFSKTENAGPFQEVEIAGAKFESAMSPGPFLSSPAGGVMSLDNVSFRDAELSVYAFLTEDGYWPTSELQADISRADFAGATIDCGDRDELHLKQSLDAMPEFFLPRFLNEQRVATFIRDNWPDVTLTERCEVFVGRKLQ